MPDANAAEVTEDLSVAPGRLRLDEQLCFALYAATNAVTRTYRPLLAELGLTYPQYLVMLALWQDGAAPVGRIAARLELESHAVTPLVRRLEAAGLVRRHGASDRRLVLVEPTERGAALEADAARAQAQVACATGLSPARLTELRRELRALAAELATATRTEPHPAERQRGPAQGEAS